MRELEGFISPRCFAFYLKKKLNKPKTIVKPKNMNFPFWNFRNEIVPEKLK